MRHRLARWRPSFRRLALPLLTLLALVACGGDRSAVSPSPTAPTPPPPIVAGARSGPTTIAFVEATPAPGSTIAGCGPQVAGCVNRVRMQFSLVPSQTGAVLYVAAFLHASNKIACLSSARTGAMQLTAGQSRPVELVFDQADNCGVPLTIATMAVVVEGTVEVASRQEWALAYTFSP